MHAKMTILAVLSRVEQGETDADDAVFLGNLLAHYVPELSEYLKVKNNVKILPSSNSRS